MKVDTRLHGKGKSNSHGARPVYYNHLDDKVDSDQEVANKTHSPARAASLRTKKRREEAEGERERDREREREREGRES